MNAGLVIGVIDPTDYYMSAAFPPHTRDNAAQIMVRHIPRLMGSRCWVSN